MDISIVIPLLNEEESLPELVAWIQKVMTTTDWQYEILLIDDGSRDQSWRVIQELSKNNSNVRGIRFRRNYGKSAALNIGFAEARGEVIITMDADLQDSPDEIIPLTQMLINQQLDMISGWKQKRYDPMSKTLPSKLFNRVTAWVSGISLHDFNCGLKAYRKDVVKSIEIYGEMHRYIPVIAKKAGFDRIGEKAVQHRERKYGVTKFGLERFVNGFLDLLSITFVTRFGKRPMHLFGTIGSIAFLAGGIVTIWLIADKLWRIQQELPVREVTAQPLFYIALTSVILGVQLFLAGFLGELISRNAPDRNRYEIKERIG